MRTVLVIITALGLTGTAGYTLLGSLKSALPGEQSAQLIPKEEPKPVPNETTPVPKEAIPTQPVPTPSKPQATSPDPVEEDAPPTLKTARATVVLEPKPLPIAPLPDPPTPIAATPIAATPIELEPTEPVIPTVQPLRAPTPTATLAPDPRLVALGTSVPTPTPALGPPTDTGERHRRLLKIDADLDAIIGGR